MITLEEALDSGRLKYLSNIVISECANQSQELVLALSELNSEYEKATGISPFLPVNDATKRLTETDINHLNSHIGRVNKLIEKTCKCIEEYKKS